MCIAYYVIVLQTDRDYTDETCESENAMSGFYAMRNNYCHREFKYQSTFQSYRIIYPYVYVYTGYSCDVDSVFGSGRFSAFCDLYSDPSEFYSFNEVGTVGTKFSIYQIPQHNLFN